MASRQINWRGRSLVGAVLLWLAKPCLAAASVSTPPELAQLRDIHLPAPISWWPLAPGWYGLTGLVLVIILTSLFFFHRHYLNGRAKRHALRLLENYRQQYPHLVNSQLTSARVSELLKRVALVYFPRGKVAGLQGDSWLSFLNNTSTGLDFNQTQAELLQLPYQPASSDINLDLLFTLAKSWISQRRKPCLN